LSPHLLFAPAHALINIHFADQSSSVFFCRRSEMGDEGHNQFTTGRRSALPYRRSPRRRLLRDSGRLVGRHLTKHSRSDQIVESSPMAEEPLPRLCPRRWRLQIPMSVSSKTKEFSCFSSQPCGRNQKSLPIRFASFVISGTDQSLKRSSNRSVRSEAAICSSTSGTAFNCESLSKQSSFVPPPRSAS